MSAMHATERPAEFPATLTSDETALVAQLKDKYSSSSVPAEPAAISTGSAAPQPPAVTLTANPTAPMPPVKMCFTCSGSGSVSECYDTRHLQRTCDACRGLGTRSDGGSGGASKSTEQGIESSAGAGAPALLQKIAAYEAELASERARLDACVDPRERELRQELVAQLDHQLGRLTRQQPPMDCN
ncbi:hypothetical protein ACK3TF_001531 [Chlorella vulgaris]